MERVTNKRIEDFPPTTLYLDDLAEIVNIVANACQRIEVRAGDYKITDARELTELASKFPTGRFADVCIQGYQPYLSADFRTYGVSVYISEDTLEQRGIVSKVRDIVIGGKKKNPGWLYGALSNIAAGVGAWQLMSKEYVVGGLLLFLSLAAVPVTVRHGMKNKVIVHSKSCGEVKPFFERKKDDIALAVISAILGGAVGYAITKLLP